MKQPVEIEIKGVPGTGKPVIGILLQSFLREHGFIAKIEKDPETPEAYHGIGHKSRCENAARVKQFVSKITIKTKNIGVNL